MTAPSANIIRRDLGVGQSEVGKRLNESFQEQALFEQVEVRNSQAPRRKRLGALARLPLPGKFFEKPDKSRANFFEKLGGPADQRIGAPRKASAIAWRKGLGA